jgi:hypothetical protein
MESSGCRAEPRHAGDGVQRPLRSRFPPRLMPSVRPRNMESSNALHDDGLSDLHSVTIRCCG